MTPVVVRDRAELAEARVRLSGRVALVPTMGALHEGHLSLMRVAWERGDAVVVSIFVNPLQFGAGEDLDRYPRTLDADLELCAKEGVDVVFTPSASIMYPEEQQVRVHAGPMGERVEGRTRPGHFDGMLTVVLKLFHLVRPDLAVFGEKDAQQLALVRRMAADLDAGVEIVGAPTVREPDGLALSSRNRYLTPAGRRTAAALHRALAAGRHALDGGPAAVLAAARAELDGAARAEPPLHPDYLVLVDPATFTDVTDRYAGPAVLAVAGRVGGTHLIDNIPLDLPGTP